MEDRRQKNPDKPDYKVEPYQSQIEPLLRRPDLPMEQKLAQGLLMLEKMLHETNDSTQIAIFKLEDTLREIYAQSHSSL